MKRLVVPVIVLGTAAALLWRYPPIRLVKLADYEAAQREAQFDAAAFARRFWDERLTAALANAADARQVLATIGVDPKMAREKFGRKVGVSRRYYYFLRGEGVVVSADKRQIGLAVSGGDEADVVLLVGPIFGSAVRDATGLLVASEFPNSQHFNDIMGELNKLVETRVLPPLMKAAAVGKRVEFVGCATVDVEPRDLHPLKVIPLSTTFASSSDSAAAP